MMSPALSQSGLISTIFFEWIERKKFAEAKELVASLKEDMRTDPELMRAEMLIRREEMKG